MERAHSYLLKGAIIFAISWGSILNVQADTKLFSLKNIHQNLMNDYKSVKHISRQKFMTELQTEDKDEFLIFDVREKDEFAVSHIKGANLLSPSTWKSTFLKKYGEQIKGKKVIFYCSVGVRSTKMAKYLEQSLKEKGAKEIYNLEEGIFGWANQGAPLHKLADGTETAKLQEENKDHSQKEVGKSMAQKETSSTIKVHPYNNHWGQLINDETIRSYVP